MSTGITIEKTWLMQLQQARQVGIAFIDDEGRDVQVYNDDPILRQMVITYQQERVRQLELDERSIAGQAGNKPCFLPEDIILVDDSDGFIYVKGDPTKRKTDLSG